MKILIVTGYIDPVLTPNVKIALNIANELINLGNDVSIICLSHETISATQEFLGIKLSKIEDPNIRVKTKIDLLRKEKPEYKYLWIFLNFMRKFVHRASFTLRLNSLSTKITLNYVDCIISLDKKNDFDSIIATNAPYEAIYATYLVETKAKKIAFQLDRFVNGNSLYPFGKIDFIKKSMNKKIESACILNFDYWFYLKPLTQYFNKTYKQMYLSKMQSLEHPLLENNFEKSNKNISDKINIIYAGSFDKKLRNPTKLLQIFDLLIKNDNNIILDLYTFGNCEKIMSRATQQNSNIRANNPISNRDLKKEFNSSDFIIVVGNNSPDEVPSKVYEIIGYCKPIMHFYYNSNDYYIELLSDYPVAVSINLNDNISLNVQKIKSFIRYAKTMPDISYDNISAKFIENSPAYVSKIIMDKLNEVSK